VAVVWFSGPEVVSELKFGSKLGGGRTEADGKAPTSWRDEAAAGKDTCW